MVVPEGGAAASAVVHAQLQAEVRTLEGTVEVLTQQLAAAACDAAEAAHGMRAAQQQLLQQHQGEAQGGGESAQHLCERGLQQRESVQPQPASARGAGTALAAYQSEVATLETTVLQLAQQLRQQQQQLQQVQAKASQQARDAQQLPFLPRPQQQQNQQQQPHQQQQGQQQQQQEEQGSVQSAEEASAQCAHYKASMASMATSFQQKVERCVWSLIRWMLSGIVPDV